MYNFPQLIKKIRDEAEMTQSDFAKMLKVSPVLIAMVETGQKEVSKKLILKLADKMDVHPASITPFLFTNNEMKKADNTKIENAFVIWGEKMQTLLIKDRARKLKKYAD